MQEKEAGQTCSAGGHAAPRDARQAEEQERRLRERVGGIAHTIVVLSGKGGVGKSTVAVNLALGLARSGMKVGLLDADIHGPSVPLMLGLEGAGVKSDGQSIQPVPYAHGLKVMSIGFLLGGRDEAVIWRGPLKMGVLKQFLSDVAWGELDYLVVDLPPGTGDEPLSICQLMPAADGAVVVTTPQQIAITDVRKCVTFCRKLGLPVLGVVENMSGFVCPHCGERSEVFGSGGGERMAEEMGVPFLARIPMDAEVMHSCEAGGPYVERHEGTEPARAFQAVCKVALALKAPQDGCCE